MKNVKFYKDFSQNLFDVLVVFETENDFNYYIFSKQLKNKLRKMNAKSVLVKFDSSYFLIPVSDNYIFDFQKSRIITESNINNLNISY